MGDPKATPVVSILSPGRRQRTMDAPKARLQTCQRWNNVLSMDTPRFANEKHVKTMAILRKNVVFTHVFTSKSREALEMFPVPPLGSREESRISERSL